MEEDKDNLVMECHICSNIVGQDRGVCELCNEPYCDSCGAEYNQFSQIDFNCCESCANVDHR